MTAAHRPKNPLRLLGEAGQSVWLDYIRRGLITSGELKRLVVEDGVRGLTSNPAIFEKAIAGSGDYESILSDPAARGRPAEEVYEQIAIADVRDAADVMRGVWEQSGGRDGFVSLEVSPRLARDTDRTLAEARRLWQAVDRPNLMIKVPGTPEGLPAITQLLSEGINVNVTLLFAQEMYERVVDAWLGGLERRVASGGDLRYVASVASFFVSRIDTLIDAKLEARLKTSAAPGEAARIRGLLGKAAIANAKMAYQIYLKALRAPRWTALATRGAQPQRLLWASTSTKNPSYADTIYVDELIGPDTVNTIPPSTLDAFRDHGQVRPSLTEGLDAARTTLDALSRDGISLRDVTDELLVDGIKQFSDAFDKLIAAVANRIGSVRGAAGGASPPMTAPELPSELRTAVNAALGEWERDGKVRRLWMKDATLWTGADESRWMGWLDVIDRSRAEAASYQAFAGEVCEAGFTQVLLLGMGGSSLCPEVLARTFGRQKDFPELLVLDSTDPSQVARFERRLDLARTLVIVSSKSGTTLEPNILKQYFFQRVRETVGEREVGSRFVAITDPGSQLEQAARKDGFRRIFFGVPAIGGRFSALSAFGLVPAAIMGLDVVRLLDRAEAMRRACGPDGPVARNAGVTLGAIIGAAARQGRDKLTLIASPGLLDLGAWLEQLVAESTGKSGRAVIPVDREPLTAPDGYGADRLFVYVRLASGADPAQDAAVGAIQRAGHPVVRLDVRDAYELGAEFFRWEIATAVAGSMLGIHPFDQPDVEASKVVTRRLTSEFEQTGRLPAETPRCADGELRLLTDDRNAEALDLASGGTGQVAAWLKAHLNRLHAGDYFALLAYVEMSDEHEAVLTAIRCAVRDRKRVATCLGFGPRFLHSTGQAYKGGPDSGVFLQITCDETRDLPVPGQKYTFGVVKAAQARGDFQVLSDRGRRALRVHLGADVGTGLRRLRTMVEQAL